MAILSAENNFKKGLLAMVDEDHVHAAEFFRQALDIERERQVARSDGRYLSYYGLSLARAYRPTHESIKACETAAGQDSFSADLQLNLGRVYLLAGKTSKALDAFEGGLRIDPRHRALRRELNRLDRRSRPPLPMLSRSHRLNRWIGRARFALGGGPAL